MKKQYNESDALPKAQLWIHPCRYHTGYTLSCLLVGLLESSAALVFLSTSSLFDFFLLLAMQLWELYASDSCFC